MFEYEEAFQAGEIEWSSAVGEVCPLCGRRDCLRRITPYKRRVVELFPYRESMISVMRLQCQLLMRTVSLLPYQLAPYRVYTVESMILAVILWAEIVSDGDGGALAAVEELSGDCAVTPWLLRNWLGLVVVGFRRAHPVLCRWFDLMSIHSGDDLAGKLEEVWGYVRSVGSRGPPLRAAVQKHSRFTGRHLLGVSSQERKRLSAG